MAFRRAVTLLTTTALAIGAVAVVSPVAAVAATSPVGAVADSLVATGHRLFLAGSTGVAEGVGAAAPARVDGIPAAHSLAEAADGTVYAADADTVYAIATGDIVTQVDTGGHGCLGDVAVTSDAVWVVSSCTGGTDHAPSVVRIATADGAVTSDAVALEPRTTAVLLASAPGAPGVLAVGDRSLHTETNEDGTTYDATSGRFRTFSTADGTLTETVSQAFLAGDVFELSPNGKRLLTAGLLWGYVYDARTAATQVVVVTDKDITAGAFTADGRFLALGQGNAAIKVHEIAVDRAVRAIAAPSFLATRSLAWDGADLRVVGHGGSGDVTSSVVGAHRVTPEASAEYQSTSPYWGQRLAVKGWVFRYYYGLPAAGIVLTVRRSGPGGTVSLGTVTTRADGTFTKYDSPTVGGTFRYSFARPADGEYAAIAFSTTRSVEKRRTGVTITTDRRTYRSGDRALVTVRLPHHYTNRTVKIYGTGPRRAPELLATKRVDSRGLARIAVYVPFHSTFTVRYAGDARYEAGRDDVRRTVRAAIGQSVSKPVAKRSGYNVYRAGTRMVQGARVRPFFRGQQIQFTAQQYVRGAWRSWGSGAVPVDKNGDAYIGFKAASGVHYRLRAWVPSTYLAYGTTGSWQYVTFR